MACQGCSGAFLLEKGDVQEHRELFRELGELFTGEQTVLQSDAGRSRSIGAGEVAEDQFAGGLRPRLRVRQIGPPLRVFDPRTSELLGELVLELILLGVRTLRCDRGTQGEYEGDSVGTGKDHDCRDRTGEWRLESRTRYRIAGWHAPGEDPRFARKPRPRHPRQALPQSASEDSNCTEAFT